MRRYYEDEDADYEREQQKAEVQRTLLPSERLKIWDMLVALVVGAGVFAGLWCYAYPGLVPDVWNDASVAAGIRPPAQLFPGFFRAIARLLYLGGVEAGNVMLLWAGRLAAALTAGCAYLLLRSLLLFMVRGRLRYAIRRYTVQGVAAGLGAVFFACSDPVWRSGQTFSPSGLLMLITVLALLMWVGFLLKGGLLSAYGAVFLLGMLAAESPMGFVLTVACLGAYSMGLRHGAICENMPLLNPIVGQYARWCLTFFWALGLVVGIAVNCWSFIAFDGLAAAGMTGADMPLMYLQQWWRQLMGAAGGLGWALSICVCVLPFTVDMVMLPRAVDEEQFLPYHVGAVFFFTGLLSFMQVAMLSALWFWTWSDLVQLNSPYFHQMLALLSASTAMFAFTVFGCDACCRNHTRLAIQRFAEMHENDNGEEGESQPQIGRGKRFGFLIFMVVAVLLMAAVLPGRVQQRTRRMLAIIDDYVSEVVKECGSVRWIFTDGSFDSRIELAAAEKGKTLSAFSMMAGNSPYFQYLRKRGVTDAEDKMSLSMGAPMTLRSWMHDKPDRLKDSAVQLGFELWKRDGKELPPCSGVLARAEGMDDGARAAGVAAANALAERIMAVYADGGLEKSAGRVIRELFLFMQWRIARIARMRAERADRDGDTESAMKDVKLSDRLDNSNESLQRILAAMDKARAMTLRQVSPREGLQLALARADFELARRYGEVILEAAPDDPNANFGVGMSYYTQKQWARAEEFLKRCLVKQPRQPAVLNNLAMTCMYQKRYDEAEQYARKALEVIPKSAEVKDTLKQIAVAREQAKTEAAPAK